MPRNTTAASARDPATLYPVKRAGRRLAILGASDRRTALPRLTFGRWKLQLTADELAGLDAAAKRYLRANGTTYGFARHLLAHVPG